MHVLKFFKFGGCQSHARRPGRLHTHTRPTMDRSALESMSKEELIKMLLAQKGGEAASTEPEPVKEEEPAEPDIEMEPSLPLSHPDEVKKQMLAIKENTCSNWQQPNIEGSPELFEMLADSLPHNTRLQYLSMHRLSIDDSVMAMLFPTTTKLSTVQYLALSYNQITDVGITALCDMILAGGLEKLEVLGLTNNKLENPLCFVEVLRKGWCPNLRQIYFKGNALSDECEAALEAANVKRTARMGQLGTVTLYFNIKANLVPPPEPDVSDGQNGNGEGVGQPASA